MVLCVISSKKYGILSKWAVRGNGREREKAKLRGIWPGWLVERLIRVYRLNRGLETSSAK